MCNTSHQLQWGLIRLEKGLKTSWRKIKSLFLYLVLNKADFLFIDFYMIG